MRERLQGGSLHPLCSVRSFPSTHRAGVCPAGQRKPASAGQKHHLRLICEKTRFGLDWAWASCGNPTQRGRAMSKRRSSALLAILAVAAGITTMGSSVQAADLPILAPARHAARWCGPCGCLHATYIYHRELRTTYGIGFDPRNYDTTEPHYYLGPMRAYPRYWVSAAPVP